MTQPSELRQKRIFTPEGGMHKHTHGRLPRVLHDHANPPYARRWNAGWAPPLPRIIR